MTVGMRRLGWLGVPLALAACSGSKSKSSSTLDAGADAVDAGADERQDTESEVAESADASPDWSSYGYDLTNSQYNPSASRISKESVSTLAETWRLVAGGGATSTPVVADGVAYFGAWDGYFYAVASDSGEVRWKTRIGLQYVRSTALLHEDRVYVAADGSLFALAREDGATLFETVVLDHPQALLDSSPKLAEGVIVLGLASYELNLEKPAYTFIGAVVGVDAMSGEILWRLPVTGSEPGPCMGGAGVSVWSSAAIDPALGLAFIGTGQTYEAPASSCNDSLLAIHYQADYEGDRLAWKATYTAEDIYVSAGGGLNGLDHDIGASPNLFRVGDIDAVGAGDKGGTYRAFARATGEPLWRADLAHGSAAQLGGVMTTAAVFDGTIFVASNTWTQFGFVVSGMHAPGDTATLYALDAETGVPRWTAAVDAPVFGSFAVSNGMLFHPSIRGSVYARDLETGEELWRAETESPIGSGVSVSDDRLYVSGGFAMSVRATTAEAHVVAFSLAPESKVVVDARDDTFQELTVDQCQEALASLQPDQACRDCLCNCDPSATGACMAGCWEQAPCLVEHCAASDFAMASGRACSIDNCSSKLLPPNVFLESLRAGTCTLQCANVCSFGPDAGAP